MVFLKQGSEKCVVLRMWGECSAGGVWRPLALSRSEVLLLYPRAACGGWWDVYLWYFHRRDSIFSRLHFYNLRASLRPRKANYNVFHSFSQFIATLYWASSPVRLFSFNKMLWKIAALPGLPGTSETRLWGTAAVWSCSRHGLINQMLGLILPFFFTFANNVHFWVIS